MHIVQQCPLDHFPGITLAASALRASGDINIAQPLYDLACKARATPYHGASLGDDKCVPRHAITPATPTTLH